MIKIKSEQPVRIDKNADGKVKMNVLNLADFDGKNPKIRMFARVELLPGEEIAYHVHEGECEQYYIIEGEGEYNDNGEVMNLLPGTITFTPSGTGHGIKNIGDKTLGFIALILRD